MISGLEQRTLRRTLKPYIGQLLILSAVTIFLWYVAQKKEQWGLLWGALLVWILFGLYVVVFGLSYRIRWNDRGVTMNASGSAEKHISFDEIDEIRFEVARTSEFLAQARPFRRIAISGRQNSKEDVIDVSLRHFRDGDIRELLDVIHRHRPDLRIPKVPYRR